MQNKILIEWDHLQDGELDVMTDIDITDSTLGTVECLFREILRRAAAGAVFIDNEGEESNGDADTN